MKRTAKVNAKKSPKVGRPSSGNPKQLISIRISKDVLTKIKSLADKADIPYQTFIHSHLERIARK